MAVFDKFCDLVGGFGKGHKAGLAGMPSAPVGQKRGHFPVPAHNPTGAQDFFNVFKVAHGFIAPSILSLERAPGRKISGFFPRASTTVDSTPMGAFPPSMTKSAFTPTSETVRGLFAPDLLALVTASGKGQADKSSSALSWPGTRMPTVSRSPVTFGARNPGLALKTRLKGPGRNFRASF